MAKQKNEISLTPPQKEILERLANSSTTSTAICQRAQIILYASEKFTTNYITTNLNISWPTALKWIVRWKKYMNQPSTSKILKNHKLRELILKCLSDAPRSGKPPKFTPEQFIKITSLACTTPESHGLPLSHWSSRSLALQAQKMGIVEKISNTKIAFFFKKKRFETT